MKNRKLTYKELMEKTHAMQRDGKRLHGFYLDLAIDEALDALHELQTAARSGALEEEVRA